MTSCPPSLRSKAATEESTPPDMATAMRILRLYVSRHSGGGTREASRSAFPLPPPASRFPALHLTSLLDDTGNDVDRSLDLFECGEAGERETDDTLRLRGRKTQRKDGGRRGQCSARAGAPDRDRNALEVESGEQSLPRKTLEEKRRRVRQAGRPPSDYTSPREASSPVLRPACEPGVEGPCGRRALRRPWGHETCGPKGSADPHSMPRHRSGSGPRPEPRPCGRGRRARELRRTDGGSGRDRRTRCWRP